MKIVQLAQALAVAAVLAALTQAALAKSDGLITEGRLDAMDAKGKALGACPLKHTEVTADIAGFIARVTVRQQFHNPFPEKIEAVYVFPLSQDAAVDRMTMKIGARTIRGQIKERGEARAIYEKAKARGNVASLLDQERPNIFTQAVANIEPGQEVDIVISYSETLKWKDGEYEFSFPMVVGPRYMPGQPTGPATTGWAEPTTAVPDANKISPPVTPEGTRAGHDISITVILDAGLPLRRIDSRQHEIDVTRPEGDKSRATIKLRERRTIPNKDFVLVYQTATDEIADAVLTHTDQRGKFFTMVLQPPKRVRTPLIVPKEIIFAIDKSGSMSGFPIETAKKAMKLCVEGMHERDTFNLICFEGGVSFCFPKSVANTPENQQQALGYLGSLQGGGGTEMMKAIDACLSGQDDPNRVRIVCFMTDGLVGNDMAILDAVKRNAGTARVFSFGIGRSVNRYLLDGMARAGRGEVHYILSERDALGAAERFYERVRTPVLTDVKLDFGSLKVSEVYPQQIPDLFSSAPIVIKGQYGAAGEGLITLRGTTGEGAFERKIRVTLPDAEPKNDVLAPLWARAKVEDLMNRDLAAVQRGQPNPAVKEEMLGLGLRYDLLTQFTSFVAVEEQTVTAGGQPKTVAVPVEMPEGVSYEGVFGGQQGQGEQLGGYGRRARGAPPKMVSPGVGNAPTELSTSPLTLEPPGSIDAGGRGLGAGVSGDGLGFSGRGSGNRASAGARYGATRQSERAVAAALNWLARHQTADGCWQFDPPADAKKGFADPGTWKSDAGATALALLPFLGAGQTHASKGPYQKTIGLGMDWLMKHQKADGDLSDGGSPKMLSHALATLVLCEAYGGTGDKTVGKAAQKAIQFIAASQDAKTSGWAEPSEGPALSVSAWQIMALWIAKTCGLKMPAGTLEKADRFLESLRAEGGVMYRETAAKEASDAATAMGLLCRLYLPAKAGKNPPATDDGGRRGGIEWLGKMGPSENDAIANLFATIFMRDDRGPAWDDWNRKMRRQLIESQAKEGDAAGSWWNAKDIQADNGGRLFQTAVNAVTVEVYYARLPLFTLQRNTPPEETGPATP